MNVEKLLFSGINSDYYEYENNKTIKLFKKGEKAEKVLAEYNKAKEIKELTDLAPNPLEMAKSLGREGIVYDMVQGDSILDLAIKATDPIYCANVLNECLNKVSNCCALKLKSYKDVLLEGINKAYDCKEVSLEIKECAINLLKTFKDAKALCNSMLEPNNIILNKGNMMISEWDLACAGCKEYELARIYVNLKIRKYPEKGYANKSIKEFLEYVYQALVKSTNKTIDDLKDYVYVVCVAMLGEYNEYGSDVTIKEFITNGEF